MTYPPGDVCHQVEVDFNSTWIVGDGIRTTGIILFGIYTFVLVSGLALFAAYRGRFSRLRERSLLLLVVSALGAFIQTYHDLGVHIYGRHEQNCELEVMLFVWAMPLVAGSILLALYEYSNKMKFAEAAVTFSHETDASDDAASTKTSSVTGRSETTSQFSATRRAYDTHNPLKLWLMHRQELKTMAAQEGSRKNRITYAHLRWLQFTTTNAFTGLALALFVTPFLLAGLSAYATQD